MIVPNLQEVELVTVGHVKEQSVLWEHEIRDPKRINQLLEHFRKHNSGYRTETRLHDLLFGWRNHEYKINFIGENVTPLMIWIGSNWLEGHDFRQGESRPSRYRSLSAAEREDLIAMIVKRDPMGRDLTPAQPPSTRLAERSVHQPEGDPWGWHDAADRFNNEKGPIAAILLDAELVEPYRIEPTHELERGIDSQKIVYKGKPLNKGFSTRLASLLLDPRSYVSPGYDMKSCIFEPRLAFRFWKRGEFLDVLICFDCNQLMVLERDPAVRFASLGGEKARFRVGGDFDPILDYLRPLMMKAFPGDPDLKIILDPHDVG